MPDVAYGPVPARSNSRIVQMLTAGKITRPIAVQILDACVADPSIDPDAYAKARGLLHAFSAPDYDTLVADVLSAHPEQAETARLKPSLVGWLVGQAMKLSGGKANPPVLNKMFCERLEIAA